MGLKWETTSGRFSDDYAKARLGHLSITADEIDGDNQPYSIFIENKGRNVPITERYKFIFRCEAFFGGWAEARKRAEYLARCYFFGIPPVYTEWELEHAEINNVQDALQRPPKTKIQGVWVRGIYYHPHLARYVRVESITNVESNVQHPMSILMGEPSVVFKDTFTDRLYSRTIVDFHTLGFNLVSEVEENMDV